MVFSVHILEILLSSMIKSQLFLDQHDGIAWGWWIPRLFLALLLDHLLIFTALITADLVLNRLDTSIKILWDFAVTTQIIPGLAKFIVSSLWWGRWHALLRFFWDVLGKGLLIFAENRMVVNWEVTMFQEDFGCGSLLWIDWETGLHEAEVVSHQIGYTLLECNYVFDDWDLSISWEFWIRIKSCDLFFSKTVITQGLNNISEGFEIWISRK